MRAPLVNDPIRSRLNLTQRQGQVLHSLTEGKTHQEIANILIGIFHTAKNHLQGSFRRLNVLHLNVRRLTAASARVSAQLGERMGTPEKLPTHLGKLASHLVRVRSCLGKVGTHLSKFPAHFSKVAAHHGKIRAHFSEVAAHLSKIRAHLSKVAAHHGKFPAHFSKVGTHHGKFPAPILNVSGFVADLAFFFLTFALEDSRQVCHFGSSAGRFP